MKFTLVLLALLLVSTAGWGAVADKIIVTHAGSAKGGSEIAVDLAFDDELTIYMVTLIMPDGTEAPQEKNIDVDTRYEMHLAWNISDGSFPSGTYILRFKINYNLIKYTVDKELTI